MNDEPRMQLGKHVLDKGILDRDGLRCGNVDDLLIEIPDDGSPPYITAIVTGPTAFARTMGRAAVRVARALHRLLGVRDARPVHVPWDDVEAVDVVVHLRIDSEHTPLQALPDAVRRLVERVPGAG